MKIRVKRIYDAPSRADGYRVLVDRLWPRGIRKADAALDEWAKGLAPSDSLRKWFGHDPDRWDAFVRRYLVELEDLEDDVAAMVARSPRETITLLYAAKDTERNNAVVLKRFIETAHATWPSIEAPRARNPAPSRHPDRRPEGPQWRDPFKQLSASRVACPSASGGPAADGHDLKMRTRPSAHGHTGRAYVDDGNTIYRKPLDCRPSEGDNEHWTGFAGFTR